MNDLQAWLMPLLMFVTFVAAILIGRWILRPVDRAARYLERPTQYTIADFLALFFLVHLVTGVIHWVVPADEQSIKWGLDALAWIASAIMWGKSVQVLSRGGITVGRYRFIFLAFVLPVAYFGCFVLPVLLAAVVAEWKDRPIDLLYFVWLWAMLALVLAAMPVCGRISRRMVAASGFVDEPTAPAAETALPQEDV